MFKHIIKTDKQEKEQCQRKMEKYSQKEHVLQQKLFFESKIINERHWKSQAERKVKEVMTILPIAKRMEKVQSKWVDQWEQIHKIDDRKYCEEERKQREAIRAQKLKKVEHVRFDQPSIYHDGTFGIVFDTVLKTGEKLKGSWNDCHKTKINEKRSSSHWDRKYDNNPFRSPFK